jgi:transposase
MLYAAIDIHKHAFQAAVLDPESGEVVEERFAAERESLARWSERWRGRVAAVVIEATTGWRWVWRELAAQGFEVRLAEPVQTRALLGRRCSAKTDRLDARWLARLLAKEMLPQSWIPPAQIQELRDRTRLRKALAEDRRRWVSACLPLARGLALLEVAAPAAARLRWTAALQLPAQARLQVDSLLAVMAALEAQLETVDAELLRFARGDERCQALQSVYGIGPILACHLLAEIGEARRFRRAEQITRLAGLDPVVEESGESRRRGHLAKAGSPHLRWALVEAAVHAHRASAPDLALYRATRAARHDGGATDGRAQDRQARLPRPARARARHQLSDRIGLDALRPPPEPGNRRLRFGMSRLSPPRLDNLRRDPSRAEIGMGLPRPPRGSRPPPRLATPTILR